MSDSKCPAGVKDVYCFNDLCQVSHCPNYPEAKCVTRSCGKCTAHYYDTSGVDITALCGKLYYNNVYQQLMFCMYSNMSFRQSSSYMFD